MRLNNKISLVTGAGSGFGRGIASRFVEEGAKVVVADINQEAAEMVAEEIGENVIAIVAYVKPKHKCVCHDSADGGAVWSFGYFG